MSAIEPYSATLNRVEGNKTLQLLQNSCLLSRQKLSCDCPDIANCQLLIAAFFDRLPTAPRRAHVLRMLNMIRSKCLPPVLQLLICSLLISICEAQQPATARPAPGPCAMPSFSTVVNEPNIFSEQQEEWLGEILVLQIQKEFNVIADPDDYLQKLGDRLLAQLPPTKAHYRFTIIDLPGNDSFGTAGGYIYLSRRIIALAQNEDEIAGLLGHEIGHIITHQAAIDITQEFRTILGVTQVGDRTDI